MSRTDKYSLVLLPCFVALALCGSCYPRISPTGPVVDSAEAYLGESSASLVDYSALERHTELPVVPFRMWGVDFAEEMLFELEGHPHYAMVEICRVRTRGGQWTWFALVAEKGGRQHVGVATEADFRLGQSFPAPVYRSSLQVERSEQEGRIEYRFSFALPDGSEMDGVISSRSVAKPPPDRQRNGSAMNHSHETALAIIDLKQFNWAKPEIRISGQPVKVRQLAPFLPYAMRLEQVAGGMAAGRVTTRAADLQGRYLMSYESVAGGDPLELVVTTQGGGVRISSTDPLLDLDYVFRAPQGLDGPMELSSASVAHGEVRVFDLRFNPPVPDLRYPLPHAVSGLMVAGVNGREGYMVGSYRVEPGHETQLVLLPDQPFWACERPLRNRFEFQRDQVVLRAEVAPSLALEGAGAARCFARRR